MKHASTLLLLISISLTSGCDEQKKLNRGFTLPEGDAVAGQSTFLKKRCIECHTIADTNFAGSDWNPNQSRTINVKIGGEVTKLKTYGDLVTSIINPSHKIARGYLANEVKNSDGESKMPSYNDVMTVTELVDLVTFLQSQYELVNPPATAYPGHIFP